MLHKISEVCDLINVIHKKSEQCRKLKYDNPKTPERDQEIDILIADIQSMCRQVAEDKQPYEKRQLVGAVGFVVANPIKSFTNTK